MNRVGLHVLVAALVFLGGCSSKELTRGRAKDMLEKQEFAQLKKQWVPLQKPTEDALIQGGYVRWRDMGTMRAFELTPEGKKYFEKTQGLFALPAMTMETTKVMPVV